MSVDLSSLQAWPDIPALASASGNGNYRTTFSLPSTWDSSYGATLSLGQVIDTFRVTVNGHAVAVDQISGNVDLVPAREPRQFSKVLDGGARGQISSGTLILNPFKKPGAA